MISRTQRLWSSMRDGPSSPWASRSSGSGSQLMALVIVKPRIHAVGSSYLIKSRPRSVDNQFPSCDNLKSIFDTELLMDILDQLSSAMDEPDLGDLLRQSIEDRFFDKYPTSRIDIYSTDNPVMIHVQVTSSSPPLDYYMVLTDEWVDQDHFRFTFTNSADYRDTVLIDLSD